MNLSRIIRWLSAHPAGSQVLTLVSASMGGLAMVMAWWVQHGPPLELWRASYSLTPLYLVKNLFLAWTPLIISLVVFEFHRGGRLRARGLYPLVGAWVLFFPNAPYLLTDLCHLPPANHAHFWIDLVLILWFGITGLLAGFLSTFLVHRMLAQRLGDSPAWLFVVILAAAGGLGICVGRFLRWYSWDIILEPSRLLKSGWELMVTSPQSGSTMKFLVLFALLLFNTYLMLYALTGLNRSLADPCPDSQDDES